MMQFPEHAESIKFRDIKIGQWFRYVRTPYMRIEAIGDGRCAVDVTGHLAEFDSDTLVDEVYIGTYTVTLT